nr:ribonuclease H-like domain, reverse transcriptase, RNA-dependent DNA polymerase [Tanacetum cinerariifolium]
MVAYLSKSNASKGFNQIIDFLNGSSIKYALTVNPNIYVSHIKQFWTTVAVNQGVDCLPNKEIFAELARIGYEKPSTKLTFYKAFFSSQWKFLIHTILQCISAKRTSWNEFSSSMASSVICLSSEQQVDDARDAEENVDKVNAGDAARGEVLNVTKEPSIPSPTPPTPPLQPPQDIPSTSQRFDTSDDTVLDDESNQGRMIAEMDQDEAVVLEDDKEKDREVADAIKYVEEAKVDESAQDQGRQAESQAEIYTSSEA